MYCPKCNAEYREGFVECNTCSIPLIDGPQAQPDSDEGEWVSTTPLGAKGTRLIFLYFAHILVIAIGAFLSWPPSGPLSTIRIVGALFGAASVMGILARSRFAFPLVCGFLLIMVAYSALEIVLVEFGPDSQSLIIGQVVGGILIPIAWFYYFYRRKSLFF